MNEKPPIISPTLEKKESVENKFLNEATPELLSKNKELWIQKCTELLQEKYSPNEIKQRLEESEQITNSLNLHHTTTISNFQKMIKKDKILSSDKLESTSSSRANTYDIDTEHGLDQFVFLRLGGKKFRWNVLGKSLSLEFNKDILNKKETFVSIQDVMFAFESEEYSEAYGEDIKGWEMYLKENFRGQDYHEVLSYIIASTYDKPSDFLVSPHPPIMPEIPGVAFLTSGREIQSEVKVFKELNLKDVEHVRISSYPKHISETLKILKDYGFSDEQIIIEK